MRTTETPHMKHTRTNKEELQQRNCLGMVSRQITRAVVKSRSKTTTKFLKILCIKGLAFLLWSTIILQKVWTISISSGNFKIQIILICFRYILNYTAINDYQEKLTPPPPKKKKKKKTFKEKHTLYQFQSKKIVGNSADKDKTPNRRLS